MKVFKVTGGELDMIVAALRENDVHTLHVAFDPIDDAVKLKVNGATWSPPFGTKEEDQ